MKKQSTKITLFLRLFYSLAPIFFILFISLTHKTAVCNETDNTALIAIKDQLLDHSKAGVFRSWNRSVNHCSWDGVTCGRKHNRVIKLDLSSRALVGTISPFIANLTFLQNIALYNNSLSGHIPPELGRLFRLKALQLFNNTISGEIPANLSACVNLEFLSVAHNNLEGKLPLELRMLSKLTDLYVYHNEFIGPLFETITNITSLQEVDASDNYFTGYISTNIGKLSNLNTLIVNTNNIFGTIPTSILNCSLLETLDICFNNLNGELPQDIGHKLARLKHLKLTSNQFSGAFPNSLSNLTTIETIEFTRNNFVGSVPRNFGRLHNLTTLSLDYNHIEGDINFVGSLVNCTNLQFLDLDDNKFTGILPESVANLSKSLQRMSLGGCGIRGEIPKHITKLVNLRRLVLDENELVGPIPYDIGKLQKLEVIHFNSNKLTGGIPDSLSNLSRLSYLYLRDNRLQGHIPSSLGDCQGLLYLDLARNNLNGTLDFFKGSSNFVDVYLSYNFLEGSIPAEIGNQINLVDFYASQNKLSGIIPDGLGDCFTLQALDIHGNSINGVIPKSFSELGSLQLLDLSRNNLSGTIPNYFSNFSLLQTLNLSYNNFGGGVPTTGVFENTSAISLNGNVNLCGGVLELHLPKCKTKKRTRLINWTISIICALVVVLLITAWLYVACHKKKRVPAASSAFVEDNGLLKVSYDMLLKATNGFAQKNLLGFGSFGSVFQGTLNGDTVAVKVLNLQTRGASKSFMAECKALRNIRHRNLVGIVTACSSCDYQENDFKALVYEFMPNGSLDGRLHENGIEDLTLRQRVDIAIDVAHALSYLLHDCEIPIVHCDLKPSNVLLDKDMVARVGDFGLAKFLASPENPNQSSSVGVRGTTGYAAPEYGLGSEPCPEGDIYSYGILVLELMTGKRPTDNMFQESYNLHSHAEADNVLEIVDPTLLVENNEISEKVDNLQTIQETDQRRVECMVSMISVGVACSKHIPRDRMKLKEAITKLQAARDNLGKGE